MMAMHFNSFAHLAQHLTHAAVKTYPAMMNQLLDEVGKAVKDQVQSDIGYYQPAAGSLGLFPAWAPLAPSTVEKKARLGQGLNGNPDSPLYATGAFHDDVSYAVDKKRLNVQIGTTLPYVIYTELGTANMPPRPVFGPAALKVVPRFEQRATIFAVAGITGFQSTFNAAGLGGFRL